MPLMLNRAKQLAKSKPDYNKIQPITDRKHYYWCEDRGKSSIWQSHLVNELSKSPDGTPELDHIVDVGTHWNTIGHNQTQAEREAWFNDINNHQVICGHHNSSKKGQTYTKKVGQKFKGPGE